MTYTVTSMNEWSDVEAEIAITDPPFGIEFGDSESLYNRDDDSVVDGYVEWGVETYRETVDTLLDVLWRNTVADGQAIIFSGWNNSHHIHTAIDKSDWQLEGKLYWTYNFAPYCTRRPAHNVYEIFWAVKSDDWYYTNECSYDHCQDGEANLSVIDVKRNYIKNQPKYPTRLPAKVPAILLDHFTESGDTVFDPLAGSGSIGLVAEARGRNAVMGDKNERGKDIYEQTTLTSEDI